MNKESILHIMTLDKFLIPFINFVDKNIGRGEHKYIFITSEKYKYELTKDHNVEFLHTDDDIFITLLKYMTKSKKIILHGLWRDKIDTLLYLNQNLLSKCYWCMWGGDFYFPEKKSKIRHEVIKKMGYLVTYIKGDYELVKELYRAEGNYIECFMYPSNLYKEYDIKPKIHNEIHIQIGNSADPTNNHIEILEKLRIYKDENIKLFIPLSYGDQKYAKKVISIGNEFFGNKFIALTEFMMFDKYLEFLSSIDIAIFNHERQQAMGNIITLLGLGKKVYLKNTITSWQLFKDIDIKVFDTGTIKLKVLENKVKTKNTERIKNYFSYEKIINTQKQLYT